MKPAVLNLHKPVLQALQKAIVTILSPGIFLRTLVPGVVAVVFWISLLWTSWSSWLQSLSDMLLTTRFLDWSGKFLALFMYIDPLTIAQWYARVILFFGMFPMMFLTALALTSFILLPLLLQKIHQAHYPMLEKKKGGLQLVSLWNGLKATFIYFAFLIVSLPLFVIPGLQLIIPLLLNAYLAHKILSYDILLEYATPDELSRLLKEQRFNLQTLGFLTAFFFYLPVLNFMAPALTALAFIFYLFEELKKMRHL